MIATFTSQKFRFWGFVSMVLLVFVHGYNLNQGYLQPWTRPNEPMTITAFVEYFLANGIFRFRIPMLFIISGYLFAIHDNKPHRFRISNRVRTLLYPYLIWSAFGLLLTYVLELFPYSRNLVAATRMMQIDETRTLLHHYHWYEVIGRWLFFPVSYQLWFIRVLLVYNIAYPAIYWCISHKKARFYFFSFSILLWISTANLLLIEGEGLLFFSLGIWIQKFNYNIQLPLKGMQLKYWIVIFISLAIIKTILAFYGNFQNVEIVLLLMHKVVVISGLVSAWYGCNTIVRFFMNIDWFKWLTSFSFMIYVVHAPIVVYATRAMIVETEPYRMGRIITFITIPFILVCLSIFIGYILRKIFPVLYSILTGNRGL